MKKVKKGDKLDVREWRTGKWIECLVYDDPYEDEGEVIVPIKFPNGDKWGAIWNGKNWESQES